MRYSREDACRAWLTYGMIHTDLLADLLSEFGCAEALYDQFVATKGSILRGRINDFSIQALLDQSSKQNMHDMLLAMQKQEIGIVAINDESYPDRLRNIPLPPVLLFYRGNLDCLMRKCISVVGTRRASPQGIEITRKVCRELSQAGVTIISGLAVGIDAAAHMGCLDGGSPTAAVMSTGIDVDYPIDHAALKDRIVNENGVLLSEYPPGTRANKHVFQMRNRIISGLGKALLMMECRIQSGSIITVQHALDQGRDVYAHPGIPDTESASGAHQLLREGAIFFTNAKDIMEDMGWEDTPSAAPSPEKSLPALSTDQRQVLSLLSERGELSFDQIADASGLAPGALSGALTLLQMMGLIKALPGKKYLRI